MPLDFTTLDSGPPLPTLNTVSKNLPFLKEVTRVSYMQVPDGLLAWVFDNKGIAAKRIVVSSTLLQRLSARFLNACRTPQSDRVELASDGRQLYSLLITPIADHLPTGRVIVLEPDGALNQVVWQALVDANGNYFGATHALAIASGLSSQVPHSQLTVSEKDQALIVASSASGKPGSALMPLPDLEVEAGLVSSQFITPIRLEGHSANRASIIRALPRAQVFHFVGHAVAAGVDSGLVLAEGDEDDADGVLTFEDLGSLHLPTAKLAVLSACSTSRGLNNSFSDPETLVRSLQHAGFTYVVASRWNIDSRVTARLMDEFYKRLLSGVSVTEALHAANQVLLKNSETDHPYFWAAFSSFEKTK